MESPCWPESSRLAAWNCGGAEAPCHPRRGRVPHQATPAKTSRRPNLRCAPRLPAPRPPPRRNSRRLPSRSARPRHCLGLGRRCQDCRSAEPRWVRCRREAREALCRRGAAVPRHRRGAAQALCHRAAAVPALGLALPLADMRSYRRGALEARLAQASPPATAVSRAAAAAAAVRTAREGTEFPQLCTRGPPVPRRGPCSRACLPPGTSRRRRPRGPQRCGRPKTSNYSRLTASLLRLPLASR
mmetsp:Transcript_48990/g.126325  ORF Transcript_48990/g.126325 Transcript_48990/m.126325 type:complete len:243 (+) Transcript_48990:4210-4938(+)